MCIKIDSRTVYFLLSYFEDISEPVIIHFCSSKELESVLQRSALDLVNTWMGNLEIPGAVSFFTSTHKLQRALLICIVAGDTVQ